MKIKKFSEIVKKINLLFQNGYQIRFPGGASANGDINANGVLYKDKYLYGMLCLLVLPYELHVKTEELFNHELDDDPATLIISKLERETGYLIKREDLGEPILSFSVPNNISGHKKKKHTKYTYLIDKFKGQPLDLSNSSLLGRETLAPFWVPVSLISNIIFIKHLKAFEAAINVLFARSILTEDEYNLFSQQIKSRFSREKKKENKKVKR